MKVIGLMGLPGSGKTTARENLEERDDFEFKGIQMKDIAGKEFLNVKKNGVESLSEKFRDTVDNPKSYVPEGSLEKQIGDWVDSILEVDDNYFATKLRYQIQNEYNSDVLVVDGIRSVPDAEAILGVECESYLIYIQTPFCVRFERLEARGREGEEDIDKDYLVDRDRQELSWGVDDILSSYENEGEDYDKEYPVEYFYSNHNTIPRFESEFNLFVDNLLGLN